MCYFRHPGHVLPAPATKHYVPAICDHDPHLDRDHGSLSGTIAFGSKRYLRSMDCLDGWDLPDLVTISNGDQPIGLPMAMALARYVFPPRPASRVAGLTLAEPRVDRRLATAGVQIP